MLHLPIPCAFAAYTTVVTPQKLCQTAYQVSCAKLTNEETVSEMLTNEKYHLQAQNFALTARIADQAIVRVTPTRLSGRPTSAWSCSTRR